LGSKWSYLELSAITLAGGNMLTKLNPTEIISAHFRSMYRYDTGGVSWPEIFFHLLFPLIVSALLLYTTGNFTNDVSGIVVSAASIVAGLMLNLLVLIYTLAYNTKNSSSPISNLGDFKKLTIELLASISCSILLCILLVIASFVALSPNGAAASIGRGIAIYLGTSTLLCLLLVLKRCHTMVNFDLKS
jgi:hypothetical protein